jgi:hypothetical protein
MSSCIWTSSKRTSKHRPIFIHPPRDLLHAFPALSHFHLSTDTALTNDEFLAHFGQTHQLGERENKVFGQTQE